MTEITVLKSSRVQLGGGEVVRALPKARRRMVGAWCFVDLAGPMSIEQEAHVLPHPHTGLQTVSWLLRGSVRHRDSLGCDAMLEPGQVNVMTAGHGITHSETIRGDSEGVAHLAQLWIALPDADREVPPAFEHHEEIAEVELDGGRVRVFAGTALGVSAKATAFSPLAGMEVRFDSGVEIPTDPAWEYGVFPLDGSLEVDGASVGAEEFAVFEGRTSVSLAAATGSTVLVLGGAPFGEKIYMWWNLIARTADEIAQARADWEAHSDRFGEVAGWGDVRIDAPEFLAGRSTK